MAFTPTYTGAEAPNAGKRVLILGGTGRVGSSTAAALLRTERGLEVVLSGRSEASYAKLVDMRPELAGARFLRCDIDNDADLAAALQGFDLVLHTAGPFQRKERCAVLEAAIAARVAYMDICDDADYSQRARRYHQQALDAGVPAITTAGIYPGVSNVMAAHMVSIARREYEDDWSWRGSKAAAVPARASSAGAAGGALGEAEAGSGLPEARGGGGGGAATAVLEAPQDAGRSTVGAGPPAAVGPVAGEPVEPKRVLYSYYTAGSGGVGPTILETSLLLAGEDVTAFVDNQKVMAPPVSGPRVVDFGRPLGRVTAWLYNLPEVASTHENLRVPSVSARFATAPVFWNWAMVAVARLAPKGFLEDRDKSKWLAGLAGLWVRPVDKLVGEAVGMRVDVELADGTTAAGVYYHRLLSQSVGVCTAAFVRAMLAGGTQPGVWFPEQREAVPDRRGLLQMATDGAQRFELNRPPWAIESQPTQLGFGMYW
ncbi:hypothetical protein WJX81_002139 [Elliptochloris bilobata]|uniref:Saccharopine dehydrogenase NADP binding domain-containing protein n=1 Tax=Elliptochloris bilobata TaxID=381761 RepID=A0AAW1R176_9CHLO